MAPRKISNSKRLESAAAAAARRKTPDSARDSQSSGTLARGGGTPPAAAAGSNEPADLNARMDAFQELLQGVLNNQHSAASARATVLFSPEAQAGHLMGEI